MTIANDKRLMIVTPRELVDLLCGFAREVPVGFSRDYTREKAAEFIEQFLRDRIPTARELERDE